MRNIVIAIVLVLAIIFLVPITVYGAMSAITGLQPRGGGANPHPHRRARFQGGHRHCLRTDIPLCQKRARRTMAFLCGAVVADVRPWRDWPSHRAGLLAAGSDCGNCLGDNLSAAEHMGGWAPIRTGAHLLGKTSPEPVLPRANLYRRTQKSCVQAITSIR
jgi:hypothetical protein